MFTSVNAQKITQLNQLSGDLLTVTHIDLSNKGITQFPSEILRCENLESLDLSDNGFVEIPAELAELENLESINFSGNQNISPLQLEELFKSCKFELTSLNISDCALFYLPKSIGDHLTLESIDFSANYLKNLPYGMMRMTGLTSVNLEGNKLRNISSVVSYWWSLEEINVSNNKMLEGEGLLIQLSYMDKLKTIEMSHLRSIPKDFKNLSATNIILSNCVISDFPRESYSKKIDRITFTNCVFENPEKVLKELNAANGPDYVGFNEMADNQLIPFLKLNVDSLNLQGNNLKNINPLIEMEELSYLDVRNNPIRQTSIEKVSIERPELEVFYVEPISQSIGVSPPFPELAPKPVKKKIIADKEQVLQIGSTILEIPKDAFVDANGNVITGEVEVGLTEYLTPEDIFLSGISMTTEDENGETLMLSSGGMIDFQVKDENGNDLQINPEKPITANIISPNNAGEMPTWRMNRSGVWEEEGLDGMMEVFKRTQKDLDSLMQTDFYNVAESNVVFIRDRFVPVIKKGDRLKDFEISFGIRKTRVGNKKVSFNGFNAEVINREYHSEYIAHTSFIYDGDSSAFYKEALESLADYCDNDYKEFKLNNIQYSKAGPNYISELRLFPDYENDNMDLKFRFKDSLVNIPVIFKTHSSNPKYRLREIGNYFNRYQFSLKKYIKEKRRNKNKLLPFLNKVGRFIKNKAIKEQENRSNTMMLQSNENQPWLNYGSVRRTMLLRRPGIGNCDSPRRMRAPRPMIQKYVSVAGDMIEEEAQQITVVDRTNNGVISFIDKRSAFFDSTAENLIVVFFAGTVGIFRSWIDNYKNGRMELNMIDKDDMSKETLKSLIAQG